MILHASISAADPRHVAEWQAMRAALALKFIHAGGR